MAIDVTSLIGGSIGGAFAKVVGVFKVPPEKVLESQTQLEEIRLGLESQLVQQVTAQIEVNKTEAASPSTFVAGWRPFIGWICGAGLACQFIFGPLFTWISNLMHRPTPFPTLDLGTLMTLLLGMLGLGGLRTYEKVAGGPGAGPLEEERGGKHAVQTANSFTSRWRRGGWGNRGEGGLRRLAFVSPHCWRRAGVW